MKRYLPVVVMALAWSPFLFLQIGQVFDEGEHAHVAWLMAVHDEQPIDDFFQHHQPLLWDLLRLYFELGGEGAAVLYFGRILVVIAGLLSVWALASIVARLSTRGAPLVPVYGAVAYWIVVNIGLPEGLVIRPEMLSVPAVLWSVLSWYRAGSTDTRRSVGWDFLAGVLFGVAVFSSPRFLLLAGLFPLSSSDPKHLLELRIRRYVAWGLGGLAFLFAYVGATRFELRDFWFNVAFSAHLQTVGEGNPHVAVPVVVTFSITLILLAALAWRIRGRERIVLLVGIAYFCTVTAVGLQSASGFLYAQGFLTSWVVSSLLLGFALSRDPGPWVDSRSIGITVVVATMAVSLLVCALQFRPFVPLLQLVSWRTQMSSILSEDGTVLLPSSHHPIDRRDASYYGSPLVDSHDRLCRAVRTFEWPLPPCDYTADVVANRPEATFQGLIGLVPPERRPVLMRLVEDQYVPVRQLLIRSDVASHNRLVPPPIVPAPTLPEIE